MKKLLNTALAYALGGHGRRGFLPGIYKVPRL